ncbi:MAG: hypothetical protein R3F50_01175 [Gammaproteobacteria bacterium]|jgi:hypothetical protein
MSNERDPHLQGLFARADETLDDSGFTNQVMQLRRRRNIQRLLVVVLVASALLAITSQFLQALQPVALVLTQVLNIELIDLGDSSISWILAPVNNLATLLVIIGKGLKMSWDKVRHSSYTT